LPENTLLVLDQDVDAEMRRFEAEVRDRYENTRLDPERRALPPERLYLASGEMEQALASLPAVRLAGQDSKRTISLDSEPPEQAPVDPRGHVPYAALFELIGSSPHRLLLVVETAGRRESLESVLLEHDILPTAVSGWREFLDRTDIEPGITVAQLERGARLPGI